MKPRYLYHGSSKHIVSLLPKKANDVNKNQDNSLSGVYATNWKKWAIIMGLFSCDGIKGASTHITGKNKIDAVYYGGKINQKYFYLYTLSSKNFKNIPTGSPQWVSLVPAEPIKVEKLQVNDFIHLIRKANVQEKKDWVKSSKHL